MVAATDTHARGKNLPQPGKGGQLPKVAKKGRHDMPDHLGLLVIFPMDSESAGPSPLRCAHVSAAAAAGSRTSTHTHCAIHRLNLADRGTDLWTKRVYLGHRDPRHTVIYTREGSGRCGSENCAEIAARVRPIGLMTRRGSRARGLLAFTLKIHN